MSKGSAQSLSRKEILMMRLVSMTWEIDVPHDRSQAVALGLVSVTIGLVLIAVA